MQGLPPLQIPGEWQQPLDGEGDWLSDDTPRSPLAAPSSLPSSPSARKTKSRAARNYTRINSLRDAKVGPPPPPPAP